MTQTMASGSIDRSKREELSFRESVKRIFLDVCDLEPELSRSRLEQLCGDNALLRQEVEKLIENDTSDSIFESDSEESVDAQPGSAGEND
jgi:hypothetical protein